MLDLSPHHLRIKGQDTPLDDTPEPAEHAEGIRSWLTALVGAEHLSLLVGGGLGIGVARTAGADALAMDRVNFGAPNAAAVEAHAKRTAEAAKRGDPNIEDQLRSGLQLLAGLEVLGDSDAKEWRTEIDAVLTDFAMRALHAERRARRFPERQGAPTPARGPPTRALWLAPRAQVPRESG